MSKRGRLIDLLCGLWLILCIVCGPIGLFFFGIDSAWKGLAVFVALLLVGLLPSILAYSIVCDDFEDEPAHAQDCGFFSIIFLFIVQIFKILFTVVVAIITFGCFLCAGKSFKGLK